MTVFLKKSELPLSSEVKISGSKSESNRLLILQTLFPEIEIKNLSDSEDTRLLQKALGSQTGSVDVHHAGTAMRFLTAFYAVQQGREVTLTGSERMQQRPIKDLVEALLELGTEIKYEGKKGFPPLKITGKEISGSEVAVNASTSSQFISALLLVAPSFKNGLTIHLKGKVTSLPYIEMTLALLKEIGVITVFRNQSIVVKPFQGSARKKVFSVESDWSSASYFYSIIALSPLNTEITLSTFKKNSLQGDRQLSEIYELFGVKTYFLGESIRLKKVSATSREKIFLDLSSTPDIAQTIAVTCLGLGLACHLTGLQTLRIKETDRLSALQNELGKLGAEVRISTSELEFHEVSELKKDQVINTYNDHRMAMSFAPLALKVPLAINDPDVVVKSYPGFWEDLQKLGFRLILSRPESLL